MVTANRLLAVFRVRPRWFRFGLRGLLLAVSLCARLFAWIHQHLRVYYQEQQVIKELAETKWPRYAGPPGHVQIGFGPPAG